MEIYRNEKQIKARISEAERVIPVANQVKDLFEKEGIEFTPEHLQGFYSGGGEYLIGVLGKLAREEIKKMNITLERMKQSFLRDSTDIDEKRVSKLHAEFYRVLGSSKVEPENLEITKTGVRLKKEFIQEIEAEFTVDLSDPEIAEMWEQMQVFCNSFNRLQELAEKRGELSLSECLDPRYGAFFTEKPGLYSTIEPDINYFLGFNGNAHQPVNTGDSSDNYQNDDPTTAKIN